MPDCRRPGARLELDVRNDTLAGLIRAINGSGPLASVVVNPASTHRPTASDPTTQVISRHARGSNEDGWYFWDLFPAYQVEASCTP